MAYWRTNPVWTRRSSDPVARARRATPLTAPSIGVTWYLGVDGISVFLVLMAALLFPLILLGAREKRDQRG